MMYRCPGCRALVGVKGTPPVGAKIKVTCPTCGLPVRMAVPNYVTKDELEEHVSMIKAALAELRRRIRDRQPVEAENPLDKMAADFMFETETHH